MAATYEWSRTVTHPCVYRFNPACCSEPATTVTVGRCTPSMTARNSWAQIEVLLVHPMARHQQPARATLRHLMHHVARKQQGRDRGYTAIWKIHALKPLAVLVEHLFDANGTRVTRRK
jgi:hypothetical protein